MEGVLAVIIAALLIRFINAKVKDDSSNQKSDNQDTNPNNLNTENVEILFNRNIDIINKYFSERDDGSYHTYHKENTLRDCMNKICIFEKKENYQPGSKYLSVWRASYSQNIFIKLSYEIEHYYEDIHKKIKKAEDQLKLRQDKRVAPADFREVNVTNGKGDFHISDIASILKPNHKTRSEYEKSFTSQVFLDQPIPVLESTLDFRGIYEINNKLIKFNEQLENDKIEYDFNQKFFNKIYMGYRNKISQYILKRVDYIINNISLPQSLPKFWKSEYDANEDILLVELKLPNVFHHTILKSVELKTQNALKPLSKAETREYLPKFQPAILLRVAYEIYRNDSAEIIKLLVLNGLTEYTDLGTGLSKESYTASLMVKRDDILNLNLEKLDPKIAFANLKGKYVTHAIEDVVPVAPLISFNKQDSRFRDTKAVIDHLSSNTNLASMDRQDFENLITELFAKEFSDVGADVKVTQSSRDRGVDAVIFNPDPIKGGKYIVQAKRYTRTVDVSAVRDLCAVVKKEGASRGILVTTSSYGRDAYEFANNEPITLLTGAELLGLLHKHGYDFKIDITEARKINTTDKT